MPDWNPKFDLLSVERFIDNIITVFDRDYARALAWASPGEELRGLQAIQTAPQLAQNWPVCNLLPFGNDPALNQDGSLLTESQRVLVEFETASRVPNSLTRYLTRYSLAGRSVLYEMGAEDLRKDIAWGAAAQRAGLSWDVSTERYAERRWEAENKFTMVVSFVLTINYHAGRKN